MSHKDKVAEASRLFEEITVVFENPEATAEDKQEAWVKFEAAKQLKVEATQLKEVEAFGQQLDYEDQEQKARVKASEIGNLRNFWTAVYQAGSARHGFKWHPALQRWNDTEEKAVAHPGSREIQVPGTSVKSQWGGQEAKVSMAEGQGATGGFLVPTEFLAELLAVLWENNIIRGRATVIPMRRRQINIPTVDQTSTTADQPHAYGGILATWTEEAGSKAQHDPAFRQVELVAHKLVCYTRASDELLDDSAIGLDAFLRSNMGFAGAIRWQEDWAFLRGTGVGQPLGIINAAATVRVARAAAGAVGINDIVNMVEAIHGDRPIWHIARSLMSNLLLLNGPAANPTYVFIPNAREGVPATLFGYPIEWSEKNPALGVAGDIVLADWSYYLIGDRQAMTIDSTNIERFRWDETSWRAVHRVDGQPWLSQPITIADGTTQISPFVILADAAAS